jgi:hypothetical protein
MGAFSVLKDNVGKNNTNHKIILSDILHRCINCRSYAVGSNEKIITFLRVISLEGRIWEMLGPFEDTVTAGGTEK